MLRSHRAILPRVPFDGLETTRLCRSSGSRSTSRSEESALCVFPGTCGPDVRKWPDFAKVRKESPGTFSSLQLNLQGLKPHEVSSGNRKPSRPFPNKKLFNRADARPKVDFKEIRTLPSCKNEKGTGQLLAPTSRQIYGADTEMWLACASRSFGLLLRLDGLCPPPNKKCVHDI